MHANTGLRAIIEAGIDYENLEDATIPIEVVTTSLTDGRERWIGHGPAVEAILASSAIPSIFPPVIIDGDMLVDGGVVNNVPISRAIAAGCDRIYVLLCGPLHYHPPPPRRPLEAQLTAFFVAIHARFVRELASLPPGVEVVVFSGGGEPSGQYRDFSATATLIEEGRAEVADVLDRYVGTSHRPRPARRCHDHGHIVTAGRYLLSNDAPEAMDRFTAFTTLFDPATFRHLDGLGLAPGWRCWEVGAGGTSVVAHLSERVGRGGHVLATDINVSWAGGAVAPNVEVLEHDVACRPAAGRDRSTSSMPASSWCTCPERDTALANMVAALRPGGVLLVEDADPALQPLSCLEEIGPAGGLANRLRRGFRATAGRTRGRPGLRALPAAPPPRRRAGPGGGRRRLPGERSRLQRPRDGDDHPHPRRAARPRHRHGGGDRPAPGQRGGRPARPGPAADDLLLGSPPAPA